MKKQPKYKHLTEQEYFAAKWMLTNKNKSEAAKAMGRSSATMTYIDRSTSYEDYRNILTELNKKNQANKAARAAKTPKPVFNDPTPTYVSVPSEDLAKMFSLLAEISEKLDRVVVPKRKFF